MTRARDVSRLITTPTSAYTAYDEVVISSASPSSSTPIWVDITTASAPAIKTFSSQKWYGVKLQDLDAITALKTKFQENYSTIGLITIDEHTLTDQLEYVKSKKQALLAEFTELGRISARPKNILADLVSSHTARRSFATNYYLQGFPTIDLMKITGHRTERSFLKYIRVSKLDTAKRLSAHIKANWSKKLMLV